MILFLQCNNQLLSLEVAYLMQLNFAQELKLILAILQEKKTEKILAQGCT